MITHSTRAQGAPGDAALRAMFAARKKVFIDLLKWDVPALADLYELDQYDNEQARYLILLDGKGRHRASARLLPTEGPHLLGELYPSLCTDAPPSGPGIWEISRFCLDPDISADERRDARDQLVTALAEYALRHGITDYVGVAEQGWFAKIRQFGWSCEALGDVRTEDPCALVALHIRIDRDTLPGLQEGGAYAPLSLYLEELGEPGA